MKIYHFLINICVCVFANTKTNEVYHYLEKRNTHFINDKQYRDIDNDIYNVIKKIPEIKVYFQRLESISKNKAHALIIIARKPTKNEPYYWVQVGYNSEGRFVTDFNFFVYRKKRLEVRFYDTVIDLPITLKEWRKR